MSVEEYATEFAELLASIYAKANDIPSDRMAFLMMTQIYSTERTAAAGIAGFRLGLDLELAVALYVQIQAVSYERAHGFFKRITSREIMDRVGKHRSMYDLMQPIFSPYNRTEIQSKFIELAIL